MTGTTLDTYTAAAAAVGSTKGPPTVNQVAAAPAAGAGADTAAAGAAEFTVPYYLQTGLTKYAPMQPVPPTKITAKNPTPLNPTSAFSIATTWMPIATIATTITESQTFSVSSMENTVCTILLQDLIVREADERHRPLHNRSPRATWRSS